MAKKNTFQRITHENLRWHPERGEGKNKDYYFEYLWFDGPLTSTAGEEYYLQYGFLVAFSGRVVQCHMVLCGQPFRHRADLAGVYFGTFAPAYYGIYEQNSSSTVAVATR